MAVPNFQSLMLPVLRAAANGEVSIKETVASLADILALSDGDRAEMLPSGMSTTFANRVGWARSYLKQAGLVRTTRRAHFAITDAGRQVLKQPPDRIDINFLMQFPEFKDFRERSNSEAVKGENSPAVKIGHDMSESTPEDAMRLAHKQINTALGQDMLDRIRVAPPSFFERLIVSLLVSMGYGGTAAEAGRAIGRSGDDGVDGVIDQDPLGLDRV
jgi:restriction system protein